MAEKGKQPIKGQQGVARTPTLDVNGQRFEGVPPADALRAAIAGAQN